MNPTLSTHDTTATESSAPDPNAAAPGTFGLLLIGLETGRTEILLTYQEVRFHLTPDQARTLGTALTAAADRADTITTPPRSTILTSDVAPPPGDADA